MSLVKFGPYPTFFSDDEESVEGETIEILEDDDEDAGPVVAEPVDEVLNGFAWPFVKNFSRIDMFEGPNDDVPSWLGTSFISVMMARLQMQSAHVLLLPTDAHFTVLPHEQKSHRRFMTAKAFMQRLPRYKTWCIPFYTGHWHWVLAVLTVEDLRITGACILDSLNSGPNVNPRQVEVLRQRFASLKKSLRQAQKKLGMEAKVPKMELGEVSFAPSWIQPDGINCGPATCFNAWYIATHDGALPPPTIFDEAFPTVDPGARLSAARALMRSIILDRNVIRSWPH